jgi:hypothetical protein
VTGEFVPTAAVIDHGDAGADHDVSRSVREHVSHWWWALEVVVACSLAMTFWYAGGGQTSRALAAIAAAMLASAVTFGIRLGDALTAGASAWARVAFVPLVVLGTWRFRAPLMDAALDFRFGRAEPALTAAAEAYLANPAAPIPRRAGSFAIIDRKATEGGVVFYANGVGPLILKRCGFAYFPTGNPGYAHIEDRWYWYCFD